MVRLLHAFGVRVKPIRVRERVSCNMLEAHRLGVFNPSSRHSNIRTRRVSRQAAFTIVLSRMFWLANVGRAGKSLEASGMTECRSTLSRTGESGGAQGEPRADIEGMAPFRPAKAQAQRGDERAASLPDEAALGLHAGS